MIRNEKEYQEAVERFEAEKARLDEQREALAAEGRDKSQFKNLMDPMTSFHLQLKEEVESYRRLKRGEFAEPKKTFADSAIGWSRFGLHVECHNVIWRPSNCNHFKQLDKGWEFRPHGQLDFAVRLNFVILARA